MPEHHAHILPANQNLFRAWSRWKTVMYLTLCLFVIAVIFGFGRELHRHLDEIGKWIEESGSWASLAFVLLFVIATSLLVPDTVLCILAGALFGWASGFAAVLVGSIVAAAFQYLLSRRLLQSRFDRVLSTRPFLESIREAVRYDEFHLQFLLRLTPLNPATLSYLLGAAGVRFWGFLIAALATAPILAFGVYLGEIGKHAAGLAKPDQSTVLLERSAMYVGLAVGVIVLFFLSRAARRAVGRAIEKSKREHSEVVGKPLAS